MSQTALESHDLCPADSRGFLSLFSRASRLSRPERRGGFFVSVVAFGCDADAGAATMRAPDGRLAQLVRALP